MIKVDISQIQSCVSAQDIKALEPQVNEAILKLENGTGAGNDFIGWTDLASKTDKGLLAQIKDTARVLRENCEVVIVAGIGGSYLGSRAVIEALSNSFLALDDLQGRTQGVTGS